MAAPPCPPPAVPRLRIFTVNDVYSEGPNGRGLGGWAQLASLLEEERARAANEGIPSLFVVCGDFLGGSALGEAFEGRHVVEMLEVLAPDMVVVGNHEFDFGDEVLSRYMQASSYPWLGTNVFVRSAGSSATPADWRELDLMPGAARWHVVDVNPPPAAGSDAAGVKVGFIGLCTPATPNLSFPSEDIVFGQPVDVAAAAVAELAPSVDAVFALTHLREAGDRALAQGVPAIKLLLGGHDHAPMVSYEEETLLVKTGMDNHYLGIIDVVFHPHHDGAVNVVASPTLLANHSRVPHPDITAVLAKFKAEQAARIAANGGNEVLFSVPDGCVLDTRSEVIRRREAPICNLIADCMHAYFAGKGAVGGIINGGFVRGNKTYPGPCDITAGDLQYELPFPKTISLIELTPAIFKAALEQMLINAPDAAGSFPHLSSSLAMEFDASLPVGERVLAIKLGSVPLDLSEDNTDTIRITITSFMAVGGDSVDSWLRGTIVEDLGDDGPHISALFIDYLRKVGSHLGPDAFVPAGRVTQVGVPADANE
ncbi:5'-Nucleotidase [Thecamonas trahens ATCC 50062]|uniref:5'-Nucleotidase n=1 Tax=Thecamonas trahens ATCC 50062 TaxID=461836 RepID=A0A0L0DGW8_THETB|nr:5'-Nucleotidase [Thecamonas trahens ATCC 50062]KNC51460.1 5'-Nucleotidase [Thecamonas trahens ATCC 50062]|eukprot:XP_013756122.1 5'-Nucleotidase [Thecamonas trahens ATCC 50062]